MGNMAQADLRRVSQAATRTAVARADLRDAIMLARNSGESLTDIGKAAGLTRQRIAQIIAEHR